MSTPYLYASGSRVMRICSHSLKEPSDVTLQGCGQQHPFQPPWSNPWRGFVPRPAAALQGPSRGAAGQRASRDMLQVTSGMRKPLQA